MEHDPLVAYFIIIDPRDSQAAFDLRRKGAVAGAERVLAAIRDRFEKGVERTYEAQESLVKELGRARKTLRRATENAGLPP